MRLFQMRRFRSMAALRKRARAPRRRLAPKVLQGLKKWRLSFQHVQRIELRIVRARREVPGLFSIASAKRMTADLRHPARLRWAAGVELAALRAATLKRSHGLALGDKPRCGRADRQRRRDGLGPDHTPMTNCVNWPRIRREPNAKGRGHQPPPLFDDIFRSTRRSCRSSVRRNP